MRLGRPMRAVALRGEAKTLQRLGVQMQRDRRVVRDETEPLRPAQIIAIGHFVIARGFGHRRAPNAAVFDVAPQLLGVRLAFAVRIAVRAAPARQRTDARRAFVAHEVIGVVAISRRAGRVDHAR
jgi:hypothetical protein